MVKRLIILLLVSAIPISGMAQVLEFRQPVKLPSQINSIAEESLPLLSPDGAGMYFSRTLHAGNFGGKFSGQDVWFSESSSQGWKNSRNDLPVGLNTEGHSAVVGVSTDGDKIYFLSVGTDEELNGLYVTSRINNYWTRPEFLHVPGIQKQSFVGVYVAPEGDVMLFSMNAPDSRGEEDLYFSVKNQAGQWSPPRNMGATLNTKGFEISPFLSPDKKRIYFASNGHGGEGDADIFYSERLYNSWETWSIPVNLGKSVNSSKFDAYFSIYGDSVAYFSSNRDGKFADIYQVQVIPVRSVLKAGQRYFSREEWNRELGGPVLNRIVFPKGVTELSGAQKELLFYIANKLQLQRSILFHVVVTEEDDPELRAARLKAVEDHLIQSGIDEGRIIADQVESIGSGGQATIVLRLIE